MEQGTEAAGVHHPEDGSGSGGRLVSSLVEELASSRVTTAPNEDATDALPRVFRALKELAVALRRPRICRKRSEACKLQTGLCKPFLSGIVIYKVPRQATLVHGAHLT